MTCSRVRSHFWIGQLFWLLQRRTSVLKFEERTRRWRSKWPYMTYWHSGCHPCVAARNQGLAGCRRTTQSPWRKRPFLRPNELAFLVLPKYRVALKLVNRRVPSSSYCYRRVNIVPRRAAAESEGSSPSFSSYRDRPPAASVDRRISHDLGAASMLGSASFQE